MNIKEFCKGILDKEKERCHRCDVQRKMKLVVLELEYNHVHKFCSYKCLKEWSDQY